MSFERTSDKPNRTLVNMTTVYGDDLRAVDAAVASDTLVENLAERFDGSEQPSYDDHHVRTVVEFLKGVDMLTAPEARLVRPLNRDAVPYDDPSFEARFLYAIRRQERPRDHLTRLFEVAVESAESSGDPQLITKSQLQTDASRRLSHDISWNETKLNMWSRLMSRVGAVTEIDDGVVLAPARGLVAELLSGFAATHDSTDLRDALDWIDEWFLPAYASRAGRSVVHRGLAAVLTALERDGVVKFRSMADASNEVDLPAGSGSSVDSRTIKSFSVGEVPDRPAYRLPMDADTRTVQR
ncbi:hypothetical protein RYH80_20010 [Halobaculum sp. MBLA0147]|uniref:hypothetical protein n=1 Tax=Halobaculum sp. MBLA0147 TaxID=3079934 RepID=UPI003525CCAF